MEYVIVHQGPYIGLFVSLLKEKTTLHVDLDTKYIFVAARSAVDRVTALKAVCTAAFANLSAHSLPMIPICVGMWLKTISKSASSAAIKTRSISRHKSALELVRQATNQRSAVTVVEFLGHPPSGCPLVNIFKYFFSAAMNCSQENRRLHIGQGHARRRSYPPDARFEVTKAIEGAARPGNYMMKLFSRKQKTSWPCTV